MAACQLFFFHLALLEVILVWIRARLEIANLPTIVFTKYQCFIPPACSARVDLAFIIDGSGSIESYGKGNFRRCLNFVRAIVSGFNTDNGQTRIAVVLFSSRPRLIFDFRRYRRKWQLLRAISRIRYPRGGTKTGSAMRYTYSRVFKYARRGVRKVTFRLPVWAYRLRFYINVNGKEVKCGWRTLVNTLHLVARVLSLFRQGFSIGNPHAYL